jgi:Pentapeptide repeats (8 copies)
MSKFGFILPMDARAVSAARAFGCHPAAIVFGFGLGALGAGAIGNYWPLQTIAAGAFVMLLAVTYFAFDYWLPARPPWKSPSFYGAVCAAAGITFAGWHFVLKPFGIEDQIEKAVAVLAATSGKCGDNGRKKALEYLSRVGQRLTEQELDCADLTDLRLTAGTKMSQLEFAEGKAWRANFAGVDLRKSILSGSDFTGADLTNADLQSAIFGSQYLITKTDKKGRCYRGANLTNAKLDGADMNNAYLIGVFGLTCEQLRKTMNWTYAVRSPELACEALIIENPVWDYAKRQVCK